MSKRQDSGQIPKPLGHFPALNRGGLGPELTQGALERFIGFLYIDLSSIDCAEQGARMERVQEEVESMLHELEQKSASPPNEPSWLARARRSRAEFARELGESARRIRARWKTNEELTHAFLNKTIEKTFGGGLGQELRAEAGIFFRGRKDPEPVDTGQDAQHSSDDIRSLLEDCETLERLQKSNNPPKKPADASSAPDDDLA